MPEQTHDNDRAGLGKVIYSVDDPKPPKHSEEDKTTNTDIQQASEESFPASDAPGYSGGSSTEST